jgi:putative sterol carrier protein
MSAIPRDPGHFFGQYVPAELAGLEASLKGKRSPGAVTFEIIGSGAWSLRLEDGKLEVLPGVASDVLVRITLAASDFEPVIVSGAEELAKNSSADRQVIAARVLTLEPERAELVARASGSVGLRLKAASGPEHRVTVTLGNAAPKLDAPDCELAFALEDLWAIQSGAKNPFELLMEGKLTMTGKVELAMALGSALG